MESDTHYPTTHCKGGSYNLDKGITAFILKSMKTAISIPDSLFEEAEALASDLGMSRSELFTNAIASFIESQKYRSVTAQLNAVYATENAVLDNDIAKMQYESIGHEDWDNNEAW